MTIVEANKPPTTKDIINWFGAGANNVVQYWNPRSGQWEPYDLMVDTWKSWLARSGDQIQYGFRLTTKSSPIRPEVQMVADLIAKNELEVDELALLTGLPIEMADIIHSVSLSQKNSQPSGNMCGGFGGEVS